MARTTDCFNPLELAEFRKMLLDKRAELAQDIGGLAAELRQEKDSGNVGGGLSTIPTHQADAGSDQYERELNTQNMVRQQDLILEIAQALKRIEGGTFGLCEATGKPISKKRLLAKPWARNCLEYEEQLERKKTTLQG